MAHKAPYVVIKNILINFATKLISPRIINIIAIIDTINNAFTGSFLFPRPEAKILFMRENGNILSKAIACNVLGAIRSEPMADDNEAAARPIGIIGPQIAILLMINWSFTNSSGVALKYSLTTTNV